MKKVLLLLVSVWLFMGCLDDQVKVGEVEFLPSENEELIGGYSIADVFVTDFVKFLGRFSESAEPFDLPKCEDVESETGEEVEYGDIDSDSEPIFKGELYVPSEKLIPRGVRARYKVNFGFKVHAFLDGSEFGAVEGDDVVAKWFVEDVKFDLTDRGKLIPESLESLGWIEIFSEEARVEKDCDGDLYAHAELPVDIEESNWKYDGHKFRVFFYKDDSYVGGSDFSVLEFTL